MRTTHADDYQAESRDNRPESAEDENEGILYMRCKLAAKQIFL